MPDDDELSQKIKEAKIKTKKADNAVNKVVALGIGAVLFIVFATIILMY